MRERDGLKRCPKCGQTKPVSEFYRNLRTADGLQVWCKECLDGSCKASRQRNVERNLRRLAGE